jgi:TRAP-type C4-dicarboxylate transport system permease small subunit
MNGANAQLDVGMNEVENTIELGNKDPRETVGEIINVAMLFLGIIAVAIILVGGFQWMTAGGSEEKVGQAKKIMGSGVIGLVIVLSAWGIASFILERLINATGN